jgi:two-component system LytT family response regulator
VTGERVRVLLVDDEPLARETLRLLMRRDEAIDVVGECRSGLEAVEAIGRLAPDLVFLDVQMPELDGFQTLARLPAGQRPIIVFVTAYDRYALKAFDAHALDYLVKPFTDDRFYAALARAKDHVRQRAFGAVGERVLSLLRTQGLSELPATNAGAAPSGAETVVSSAIAGGSSAANAEAGARTGNRAVPGAISSASNDAGARADTSIRARPAESGDAAAQAGWDAGGRADDSAPSPAPRAESGEAVGAGDAVDSAIRGRGGRGPALVPVPLSAPGPALEPAAPAAPAPRPLERIAVKANGRVTLVRVADIDWIEACDDHVRLHVGAAAHELRQPLKDLAARLDGRRFVRIHRSAIVNLDRVQELQPHFHGSFLVILRNGASLPLSRARREELRTALGGLLP